MTLGEEVLDALREFGLRYGYFEYEQVQRLRKVETAEDLRSFLDSIGSYNVQESTDARAVTRGLARVDSPSTFLTGCATILFLFFGSFGGGLALSAIVWLLLGSLIGDLPLVQAIAGSIFVPAFFVLFFEIELFIVRVRWLGRQPPSNRLHTAWFLAFIFAGNGFAAFQMQMPIPIAIGAAPVYAIVGAAIGVALRRRATQLREEILGARGSNAPADR